MAVIALIGDQSAGMLTEDASVIEGTRSHEQQVLELAGIAVIEHLAEQAVSHCVAGTARELIDNQVLVNNQHIHAIHRAVHLGKTLGLLVENRIGDNEHIGRLQAMQVLVGDRLIFDNLLQRLSGVKSHIL